MAGKARFSREGRACTQPAGAPALCAEGPRPASVPSWENEDALTTQTPCGRFSGSLSHSSMTKAYLPASEPGRGSVMRAANLQGQAGVNHRGM